MDYHLEDLPLHACVHNNFSYRYCYFNAATPVITKQPLPTVIRNTQSNVNAMVCVATGIGPIYYRWEKYQLSNNSWIRPSDRAISITSLNLTFSVITEEDEGVYHCILTNNDGSTVSDNATITVYGELL